MNYFFYVVFFFFFFNANQCPVWCPCGIVCSAVVGSFTHLVLFVYEAFCAMEAAGSPGLCGGAGVNEWLALGGCMALFSALTWLSLSSSALLFPCLERKEEEGGGRSPLYPALPAALRTP